MHVVIALESWSDDEDDEDDEVALVEDDVWDILIDFEYQWQFEKNLWLTGGNRLQRRER